MKQFIAFIFLVILLSSCLSSKQRKTAEYYFENQEEIKQLINTYEDLYAKQAFALGYSDKRFKYYTLQLYTDTVRYIYNTRYKQAAAFDEMLQSPINREEFIDISRQIHDLRCLWIDKFDFYINGNKNTATYLSFKSLVFSRPFEENKYYVVIFSDKNLEDSQPANRYSFHKIKDGVYFGIRDRFR